MLKEYWATTLLSHKIRIDRHQFKSLVKRDTTRIKITRHKNFVTAHFLEVSGREIASIDLFLL